MKNLLHGRRSYRFARYAAICAASAMLLLYGMTGRAAGTGTVNNDNVNVRTQASTESEQVCKLSRNTELAIVDQTTGNDGNVWYSVTFTLDGAEKSGWIRSDMVTVTETEEPGGEGEPGSVSTGSYSIQEPIEAYPGSDVLSETGIQVGENTFTAWVVDAGVTGGRELYLVWASDAGGSQGWFYYDPQDGTFQREMGQFSGGGAGEPEGMIQSLQNELGNLKEESAKSLSKRLYVIIGLGALSLILLIIVIVLAIKLRGTEYEYYDDDDEDDDEDDYEDYEEPKKKRGGLFRRRAQEEEDDEEEEKSDFDDLLIAVKKKWAEEEEREAYVENYGDEEYEEDDFEEPEEEEVSQEEPLQEEELPEIDMSAVLEIEKKAEESILAEEELDDFDIEILDLDDLDL